MTDDRPVGNAAAEVLLGAGMSRAELLHTDEGPVPSKSGFFLIPDGRRAASVVLMVSDQVPEAARDGQRDEMFQQARAALDGAGWGTSQNSYGTLRTVRPKDVMTP